MVSQQLSAMVTIKLDIWELMDVSPTLFYINWINGLMQDLIKHAVMVKQYFVTALSQFSWKKCKNVTKYTQEKKVVRPF